MCDLELAESLPEAPIAEIGFISLTDIEGITGLILHE